LGDECGFAPLLNTPDEALTIIEEAIAKSGSAAAASGFYDSGTKLYEVEVGVKKTGKELMTYCQDLVARHPAVVSIGDGLNEKDYENWAKPNEAFGSKIQLVGDVLYTTNSRTIARGLEGSGVMQAARLIFDAGQTVMVSHRSGESCN
jgi:enolase